MSADTNDYCHNRISNKMRKDGIISIRIQKENGVTVSNEAKKLFSKTRIEKKKKKNCSMAEAFSAHNLIKTYPMISLATSSSELKKLIEFRNRLTSKLFHDLLCIPHPHELFYYLLLFHKCHYYQLIETPDLDATSSTLIATAY